MDGRGLFEGSWTATWGHSVFNPAVSDMIKKATRAGTLSILPFGAPTEGY
jgi:hypothetical protein